MSITVIIFGIWAVLLATFGFVMTRQELSTSVPGRPAGDTTLSPNSVNWIGALGLGGAIVICWFS